MDAIGENEPGRELYLRALAEARKSDMDVSTVSACLAEASNLGNGDAAYALATWYLHGKPPVISVNFSRAIELLQKAASKRIPAAFSDLAISYEKGVGVKRNLRLAFENHLQGALSGDDASMYEVGRCYFYGIGVSEDRRVADVWLEHAAELGIDSKTGKVDKHLGLADRQASASQETPRIEDVPSFISTLRLAIRFDVVAMHMVANSYRDGSNVPKDQRLFEIWDIAATCRET